MGRFVNGYVLKWLLTQVYPIKTYLAVNMRDKKQYAISLLPMKYFQYNVRLKKTLTKQLDMQGKCRSHPFFVKYIQTFKTVNNFYFVRQYCNGGTLKQLIQRQRNLQEEKVIVMFRQLVQVFKMLDKINCHLKLFDCENILIHQGNIKYSISLLEDFKQEEGLLQCMCPVQPIYLSPESCRMQVFTPKALIWTLGVFLFEMVFNQHPFELKSGFYHSRPFIPVQSSSKWEVTLPSKPKISYFLKILLERLLVEDEKIRIGWAELEHMNSCYWSQLSTPSRHNQEVLTTTPQLLKNTNKQQKGTEPRVQTQRLQLPLNIPKVSLPQVKKQYKFKSFLSKILSKELSSKK